MVKIVFGTDGWRGIFGQDFTFDNVKVVAQALADYLKKQGLNRRGLVIGYDTRFLSDMFAKSFAEVIASNNIPVLLSPKSVPTPVVSFTVKNRNAGGGVVITASHNAPKYNGIKFKPEYGGSALTPTIKEIESLLYQSPVKHYEKKIKENIKKIDFEGEYINHITKLVNLKLIEDAGFKILVDAMHGSGDEIIERLLSNTRCKVKTICSEINPTFGGRNPEPIPQNLQPLIDEVIRWGADIGLATDGDADRIGVITAHGKFVTPHEISALLILHLYQNRGWRGGIVKTASVCNIIYKVAEKLDLPVYDTAVGFRNICEIMLKEDILIGVEESGGMGFKNHVPERDGILAALLLLEMLAMEGQNINEALIDLRKEFGEIHYDRIDLQYDKPDRMDLIPSLQSHPPCRIRGLNVEKINTYQGTNIINGIKFYLSDKQSWLLIRAAETEPVIRIYAEATSDKAAKELLKEGQRLLKIN